MVNSPHPVSFAFSFQRTHTPTARLTEQARDEQCVWQALALNSPKTPTLPNPSSYCSTELKKCQPLDLVRSWDLTADLLHHFCLSLEFFLDTSPFWFSTTMGENKSQPFRRLGLRYIFLNCWSGASSLSTCLWLRSKTEHWVTPQNIRKRYIKVVSRSVM